MGFYRMKIKDSKNLPIKDLQEGWTEAFNAIADSNQDELLIDLPNEFDEEEWS
jgi:hypothetical protein